jgi:hypothetical protein
LLQNKVGLSDANRYVAIYIRRKRKNLFSERISHADADHCSDEGRNITKISTEKWQKSLLVSLNKTETSG